MAAIKVRAIVLGTVNIKEKDKLVNLFTLEQGKMTVSMRGVRGDKAKLKSAKEIFCFGEFLIEQGKNSNIVTSVDIIDNFYNISLDIEKYYEACAIIDIVKKSSEEPNPTLFIETIKALKILAYDKVGKYLVIDKFLLNFFNNMGYAFLTEKCSSCGAKLDMVYFDLNSGDLVCPACKTFSSIKLSPICFSSLKILNNCEYDKLETLKLNLNVSCEVFNILVQNYEWRTGGKVLQLI